MITEGSGIIASMCCDVRRLDELSPQQSKLPSSSTPQLVSPWSSRVSKSRVLPEIVTGIGRGEEAGASIEPSCLFELSPQQAV